jgi:hypothetical protein
MSTLEHFQDTVSDLRITLEPLAEKLETTERQVDYYEGPVVDSSVFLALFITSATTLGMLVMSVSCDNVKTLQASWAAGMAVNILYVISAFFVLGLVNISADFCSDPTESIVEGTDHLTGDTASIVSFYSSGDCSGDDLIGDNLVEVAYALYQLESALNSVMSQSLYLCSFNSYYRDFFSSMQKVLRK